MTVASLKQLALRRIDHPAFYKKLKTLNDCPYHLVEPVLRHMTHHQLLTLEANTPRLADSTQPLWKLHTLKLFPNVVDTYDIDSVDVAEADWRSLFHELQDERQEREEAARNKLKANYNQIASGKSDRKIQVIKKSAPSKSQIKAGISKASSSSLTKKSSSILGKAFKASMASPLRNSSKPAAVNMQHIRPSPTASPAIKSALTSSGRKSLPQVARPLQPSKFLTTAEKRMR